MNRCEHCDAKILITTDDRRLVLDVGSRRKVKLGIPATKRQRGGGYMPSGRFVEGDLEYDELAPGYVCYLEHVCYDLHECEGKSDE